MSAARAGKAIAGGLTGGVSCAMLVAGAFGFAPVKTGSRRTTEFRGGPGETFTRPVFCAARPAPGHEPVNGRVSVQISLRQYYLWWRRRVVPRTVFPQAGQAFSPSGKL